MRSNGNGKTRIHALLSLGAFALFAFAAATLLLTGDAVTEDDVSPGEEGDLRPFPHSLHVDDFDLGCMTCHQKSERPDEEVKAASPLACQECHDRADVAPFFPAGSYHAPGWKQLHQFQSRAAGERCTVCHEGNESCTTCHQGENLDLLVHPRNYLFMHPVEARHGDIDCQACHRPAEFCTSCHAAEGVMPGSHRIGGWRSGPVHGAEARRDVETCAVCHSTPEPVCLDCHDSP